jgi:replicative DNA helicase
MNYQAVCEVQVSMNLSESEQESVLGWCLAEYNFFLKCKKNIKKTYFTYNPIVGVIFDQLCKMHDRDSLFIKSIAEFKQDHFFNSLTLQDQKKYYDLIDRCIHSSKEFGLERLRKKLTGFMRVSLFKESIEGGAKRFGIDGMESAYEWTKKKIIDLQDATFEDNRYILGFDDASTWVLEAKKRRDASFSTGCKNLDVALGNLNRGECVGILSPSNQGKTRLLTTLARHLVMQNLHVMFFVHEGSPSMIREQILCSFLCVSRERLFQMIENPQTREIVNQVGKHINKYLTFIPYITSNMYVEDVVSQAKELNDELKNRTGKGYDVIINDYPKKLKSKSSVGSKDQLYRVSVGNAYDAFNPLSIELDVCVIYAIQTNRSGSRQNNGSVDNDKLLSVDEADESFSIIQTSAAVISLNRSPEDRKLDILRLCVVKSRNSETDITVNTRASYKTSVLFGDKEMIDNGGAWDTEIDGNVLESYIQNDNKKAPANIIDQGLKDAKISLNNEGNGIYSNQHKLEG